MTGPSRNGISVKACQRAIELSSARRCCCSARPGSATPTSAVAIGRAAILAGYAVLFIQATTLAAALARAHGEGRLEDKLTQFAKPRLLIVDELGYLPFEPDAAHLFFQLVSRRYERGSKLITSNRAIGEWGRCLGDPVVRRRSGPPPAPQPGRHYPWRQLSAAREAPLGPAQGGGRPARAGADRLGPGSPRWAYRSLPPAYGARLMARGRRALPWTTWTSLPRYGHQHRKGVSSSCRQGVTSRCRSTPVRNAFLEIEFVEQPILSTNRWPHHRHSRLTTSGQGITPPQSFQPSSSSASAKSGRNTPAGRANAALAGGSRLQTAGQSAPRHRPWLRATHRAGVSRRLRVGAPIGRGQQPFLKSAAYLALQADLWGERTSPKDVPERSRTPLGRAWPGQCRIVSDCGF